MTTSEYAEKIINQIKTKKGSQAFNFSNHHLNDDDVKGIQTAIKENLYLSVTSLNLANNDGITSETARLLGDSLDAYPYLKELNLAGNALVNDGSESIKVLINALKFNPLNQNILQTFNLSRTGLNSDCAYALAAMLESNYSLTHLDLSHNPHIRPQGIERLIDSLGTNTALTTLNLTQTGFNKANCIALAKILGVGDPELKNNKPEVGFVNAILAFSTYCYQAILGSQTNYSLKELIIEEELDPEISNILQCIQRLRSDIQIKWGSSHLEGVSSPSLSRNGSAASFSASSRGNSPVSVSISASARSTPLLASRGMNVHSSSLMQGVIAPTNNLQKTQSISPQLTWTFSSQQVVKGAVIAVSALGALNYAATKFRS